VGGGGDLLCTKYYFEVNKNKNGDGVELLGNFRKIKRKKDQL
jgi:hypothetical protein